MPDVECVKSRSTRRSIPEPRFSSQKEVTMRFNSVYLAPVFLIMVGVLCLTSGFVWLATLHATEQLYVNAARVYVPVLCGAGLVCLLVGGCVCCTLQQRIDINWRQCRRLQAIHNITLGSSSDPDSCAQPIISGYDPRHSPWDPDATEHTETVFHIS